MAGNKENDSSKDIKTILEIKVNHKKNKIENSDVKNVNNKKTKTNTGNKNNKKKYKIDSKDLIIEETLQHIHKQETNELVLIDVLIGEISPKDTNRFIEFTKEFNSHLIHLKKFKKVNTTLHCVISDNIDLDLSGISVDFISTYVLKVPKSPPTLNEELFEFSQKYWPMIYKGDPNIQQLQQLKFDFTKIEENVQDICEISRKLYRESKIPIVTRIYDPVNNKILSTSVDSRFDSFLSHSIINCINDVSKHNKTNDNNYLCLNYDVYTTHEPCSFCCMALIHSRIGKLIYVQDSKVGGISNYYIQENDKLNWKFYCFRYLKDVQAGEVNENLYA